MSPHALQTAAVGEAQDKSLQQSRILLQSGREWSEFCLSVTKNNG